MLTTKEAAVLERPMKEKVDPALLAEMERGPSGRPDQKVAVLIRTKQKIDRLEVAEIEKRGGEIRSVIGDIVTAQIPIQSIRPLATLEFVVYIEKAKRQRLR